MIRRLHRLRTRVGHRQGDSYIARDAAVHLTADAVGQTEMCGSRD
jgi:hypothetical protein